MSRTTKALCGAALLLCGTVLARGGEHLTSTYNFLRSDVGARAAALAGAFLTMADDPTVVFYNPAGIATLSSTRGSIGFFKELLDVNSGHIAVGTTIEDVGTVAGGILFTHYGDFTAMDESGNTTGTFSAVDMALTLGYGVTIEGNLSVGGAIKVIHSSLAEYSSTALAVDAGALYRIPDAKLALGLSVRNLGAQLDSYVSTTEDLPLDVAFGASIVPKGLPLLLNVGIHRLADKTDTFADRFRSFMVGGEFTLSRVLQLRVGFDNARRSDLKVGSSAGLAGFSAGLGIRVTTYRVDYSLNSLGAIGNLHRVTLNAEW